MEQLQLKEIVGYLPYGLKAVDDFGKARTIDWECQSYTNTIVGLNHVLHSQSVQVNCFKPILFPLSSLTQILSEIYNEFKFSAIAIKTMPYATIVTYQLMGETFKDIVYSQGSFDGCPMYVFNKLLEKKVDVYNLIGRGLAIEVTETFNPYLK